MAIEQHTTGRYTHHGRRQWNADGHDCQDVSGLNNIFTYHKNHNNLRSIRLAIEQHTTGRYTDKGVYGGKL